MKVAIITPSTDMVHADYAACLAKLIVTSASYGVEVCYINPKSALVQKARWQGVNAALEIKADKILFIDSDQTFPANGLLQLLSHNKKIVGATCRMRTPPHEYTARDSNGERIDFSQRKGLHEVTTNGFPFCLIDANLFKLTPEQNWFNIYQNPNTLEWVSEDENFCKNIGVKIWVDANLTKQIGHLGVKEYK